MDEVKQQVLLTVLTAIMAAVILIPTFLLLKWLMDLGLEVALPAVVLFGILLAYLINRQRAF